MFGDRTPGICAESIAEFTAPAKAPVKQVLWFAEEAANAAAERGAREGLEKEKLHAKVEEQETSDSLSRLHRAVSEFVVPAFVMAFPVDRNLLR